MTARERQGCAGVTLAARAAPAAGAEREAPPWEELYRALPPEAQDELFALAARQGLLLATQLPAIDPGLLQQRRQLLAQLLSGKVQGLAPFSPAPVPVRDEALDAAQREAVARAVQTPDVCLIQGLPGAGKSRVAAEIVRQAAARGERVLFVAATPAALDRVLEQLASDADVYALRCLHPGETRETLPPGVLPFTLEDRARAVCETAVRAAQDARRA